MSAHFGIWPFVRVMPVGRCVVNSDGSQADFGPNMFATAKLSTGVYTVAVDKPQTQATPQIQVQSLALYATVTETLPGTFTVHAFDAAGVATDAAFIFVLFAA